MSKKKRSKIMAALLCATTMAAFYTAPQMVYAEYLNFTADGTVTTNSAGNTAITDLEGLESITFGVVGEAGTAGVKFYMDTQYNGLVVGGGALTAEDLYITVQDTADGDSYNSNRYSLRNTLGIHRIGTGDQAVTNIEANSLGHGGMQVASDKVLILDGTAVFTNTTDQSDGGKINFDGKCNSEQGMTVGSSFELTNAGKITKVTGIDVQGALTTTGTINSMNIGNNQVNGVTLQSNNVTANIITGTDVTDGTYHLTQVGKNVADVASDVEELNEKTTGMTYSNGSTTFTSKVVAYGGLQTGNGMIFDVSNNSFSVSDAAEVIKAVNDRNTGLEATYDIASGTQEAVENKTTGLEAAHSRIDDLNDTVSTFDDRITTNAGDISTNKTAIEDLGTRVGTAETEIDGLQTVTTGMSYNDSTGTTFAKDVTATDFKIGDISLNAVAQAVNNETKGLAKTYEIASKNQTGIATLNTTVGEHTNKISSLDTTVGQHTTSINDLTGKVTTAEGEIDALQSTTADHEGRITANTNNITSLTSTVNEHENNITALEKKTHGFDSDGNTLNLTTITATTGTVGNVTFNGGVATGLTAIEGDSVTVAGTAISKGSFNGVNIANTDGKASINGISIYQDQGDYYVGNVNISDLTSGSGATVEGIVRTENGEGGHITTIEENLKVNTNGEIANHDNSFKVDANGNVTAADFKVGSNSFNTVVNDLNTLEGVVGNADSGLVHDVNGLTSTVSGHTTSIEALETTVGNESSGLVKGVNDLNTTVTGHTTSINSLTTIVGDENSGLVKDVNTLETTVEGHTDSIKVLTDKTQHFNNDGSELTGLTNITSEEGTIGGIGFKGNAITNVKTIGADTDTINLAGNAINKGSFNGVAIGVENGNATFNGVSIYEDTNNDNDVMVGGINLSDLESGTSTKLEGIVREANEQGGGYTTTIEGALKVNSATQEISNADESFKVAKDGTVTGKDFKVGETTLTGVATDVTGLKTATTGMTFTEGKTNFAQEVKANNFVTDSADLNALSETVNKADTGLVAKVGALETKTTDMTYDAGTKTTTFNNNLKANNFEAATGKLGNMAFSGYSLGAVGETITIAGAEITSNSFNKVSIYQQDDDYYLGDVNVSALKSSQETTTDMLRGITYSSNDPNNYTMTFAGMLSVSTSGEYLFKDGNGGEYDLGDLVNTTTITDDQFKDLADAVGALEDKTTGIEFNKETGETTISHMNGADNDKDGVNDTFTKGDNFFAVNESGITANGDTFVKGEGASAGGGSGAGTGTEKSDHFVDGNQTVGGDQYVTGDVNATNGNYTGNVGVGGDVFIDANGDNVLNDGEISLSGVSGKVDSVSDKVDSVSIKVDEVSASVGDVSSVNSNIAGDSNDDGENDLAGAVNNEYEQRVEADNALNERINSIDNRMGELEDRIDKVGAMAAAIANLRTMGYDPTAPTEIAVGIGQYRDETGAALGLFHYPNRDFMLSMSVSTSGDEVMGGIGATWKFGRKSPEKVAAEKAAKAEKAKLQKAEAIKEAARAKKVAEQQHRHAELAAKEAAAK